MRLVVDASVVVKWIFPDRHEEPHLSNALAILQKIKSGDVHLLQPPHWLAEVASVCVRLKPAVSQEAVELLFAMGFPVAETMDIYQTACDLSKTLHHHLYDTLYHAVALCHRDIQLVTADMQYYQKAKSYGGIVPLSYFIF